MTHFMQALWLRLQTREQGATAVEYALMVALIAAVIIVAVTALGTQIKDIFENITATLSDV